MANSAIFCITFDAIWHMRGTAPAPRGASDQEVTDRIELLLIKQYKTVTAREPSRVVFDNPLWTTWLSPNWLALVAYDHGDFSVNDEINGRVVRYDLRSLHALVFCFLVSAIFACFGFAARGFSGAIEFTAFAFSWLYGMNMLLAWTRVPRLIGKAMNER